MTEDAGRFRLRQVAFFGRTLDEYLEMFALDLGALRGRRVLDVASGPGSFVAECLARGLDVTGCDPQYARDADAIVAQGRADVDACREQIRRNPESLQYADIDAFYRAKHVALDRFSADFRSRGGEGRYVTGCLPALPFADRAFDLVLSANLLMIYAPLADGGMHDGFDFDLDFHLRAVTELARVARHEVRIPGMHTWGRMPVSHPYCEPMMAQFENAGYRVELVASRYDDGASILNPASNRILVATRSAPAPRADGGTAPATVGVDR